MANCGGSRVYTTCWQQMQWKLLNSQQKLQSQRALIINRHSTLPLLFFIFLHLSTMSIYWRFSSWSHGIAICCSSIHILFDPAVQWSLQWGQLIIMYRLQLLQFIPRYHTDRYHSNKHHSDRLNMNYAANIKCHKGCNLAASRCSCAASLVQAALRVIIRHFTICSGAPPQR